MTWRCHWAIPNRRSWLKFLLMILLLLLTILFSILLVAKVLSLTLSSAWLSHWYNDDVQLHMKFIILMVWLCIWEEATRGNIFLDQQTSETSVVQRLLLLTRPSQVTAHWVTYQWNLQQTWEWAFPVLWNKMVMKSPLNHGQTHDHKRALLLEIGTCHLPLQILNRGHYSCWPLTSPE